jgi:hypothetical protein
VPGGEGVEGGQGRALDGREEHLEALAGLGAIAGALRLIAEAWWLPSASIETCAPQPVSSVTWRAGSSVRASMACVAPSSGARRRMGQAPTPVSHRPQRYARGTGSGSGIGGAGSGSGIGGTGSGTGGRGSGTGTSAEPG